MWSCYDEHGHDYGDSRSDSNECVKLMMCIPLTYDVGIILTTDVGKVDLMMCEKAKMVVSAHNRTTLTTNAIRNQFKCLKPSYA